MSTFPDLNLIQQLVSIVHAGTMSSAARHLGVTRSQVSRNLKKLERDMGAQLIRRTTRRLELTQQGMLLYEHGLRIIQEAETARYLIQKMVEEPTGYIRVSIPTGLGHLFLSNLLTRFVKRFKGIRLRVLFSNRVEDLISSEIDIAVRVVDEPPIDYVARKVARMHWHLCASPKYLESVGKIRSPQQLQELDFLMPPPSKRNPLLTLERAGERQAVRITTKLESESFHYLQEAAEQDAGIVLLPSYCAIQAVREQKLQRVLPEFQVLQPMNNLYILTAPNPYPSSSSRAVVEFLAHHLAEELEHLQS